jgi:hypothetical protein
MRSKIWNHEIHELHENFKKDMPLDKAGKILYKQECYAIQGAVFEVYCEILQRKNISIKLDAPSDPVEIHANRHLLKIALINVLRYLTRLLTEGEELNIVVENGDEPLVTFSARSEGIQYRAGDEAVVNIEAVDETAQESSLELVRQILIEHQSSIQVESDGEGRKGISIRFPRVFQEQGAVSVGNIEQGVGYGG